MADEVKRPSAPAGTEGQAPAQAQAQPQFSVDTTTLSSAYANFCRVTGTPEELVLDCGLNTQMTPVLSEAVKLNHRLVMNYYTARIPGRSLVTVPEKKTC